MCRFGGVVRLLAVSFPILGFALDAGAEEWRVRQGVAAFTIARETLESSGLSVDQIIASAAIEFPTDAALGRERSPLRLAFALGSGANISFQTTGSSFEEFTERPAVLSHEGGFVLSSARTARNPEALVSFFDFSVDVCDVGEGCVAQLRAVGSRSALFEVRNADLHFDAETRELSVRSGDLVVGADGARELGRPDLAERYIGSFDLRLPAEPVLAGVSLATPPEPVARGSIIDVSLAEVYLINDIGRLGTYPDGRLGLSFYTTSCNEGDVAVPWHAPMAEDHPFIGLAMFREQNGRLEMIGQSWLKHGFYALANDQCGLGCLGGGGGILDIGCSDTYSIFNNGSAYYLGPREEVNPHTCTWNCLGSWFDGTPVDCIRDETGEGVNDVEHRIDVYENELDLPGARYFYEGVYYVADDVNLFNNFGWRECTMEWVPATSQWVFTDVGDGFLANPGPVVLTWGDEQYSKQVAIDDGFVILATEVTDLGGGTWHYEYALYNQTSDRGIDEFAVPVGPASLSNVGFRDIDRDPANDWTFSQTGGLAIWETPAFGDPAPSHPLTYQTLFNFWFDADVAPQVAMARMRLHKPGTGTETAAGTHAPHGDVTSALPPAIEKSSLALYPNEPNPFARSTRISFALDRERDVRLFVTDVTGRVVRTLATGTRPAGSGSVDWDGRDAYGEHVASGIYFFRLESADESLTRKGILLR